MPELPRLVPQGAIQPGASSPTVGLRNDIGIGIVGSSIQDFAHALTNLDNAERASSALNKASDDHVQYLQSLSELEQTRADPKTFQAESLKLSKQYLTGNDKATLEYFGGDAKALQIYKSHLNPQIESGFQNAVRQATQRRVAAAGPNLSLTMDTLMRDALALGPGHPSFNKYVQDIKDTAEFVSEAIVPDKQIRLTATLDKLHMGLALQQVRNNPLEALDELAKNTFSVELVIDEKIRTMSPEMRETLVTEGYQHLNREQAATQSALAADTRVYERTQKVRSAQIQLGLMRNDPVGLNMLVAGTGLDQQGRPLIDASELRSLHEFNNKMDQERVEGRLTKPDTYGRASTRVRNGGFSSAVEIYNLKDIALEDKHKLNAQFLSIQEKMRDHTYQDYHARLKRGEDHIRAMVKSKNPLSGMGEVDAVADGLVQTYYAEMEQKELALQTVPGATTASLRPVEHASEFMLKKQEFLATTYEHDAEKVTHQLGEFLPVGEPISYENLFRNIEQSKNTRVGKLILKSLAYQMEKQGITPNMMGAILQRNTTTKKAEPSMLDKLLQGARKRFDEATAWEGTLSPEGQ